ncbi:hypothetical protein O3P69_010432 [Scylla paramamosain]|uniref:Uncharacterized protein n=1 Tax=Scylla paramamosain TaxID=85552 RepID=A0AAW0TT37_SCYPA
MENEEVKDVEEEGKEVNRRPRPATPPSQGAGQDSGPCSPGRKVGIPLTQCLNSVLNEPRLLRLFWDRRSFSCRLARGTLTSCYQHMAAGEQEGGARLSNSSTPRVAAARRLPGPRGPVPLRAAPGHPAGLASSGRFTLI